MKVIKTASFVKMLHLENDDTNDIFEQKQDEYSTNIDEEDKINREEVAEPPVDTGMKSNYRIDNVTPKQASAVEWALDVMQEHWCTESGAEERHDPYENVEYKFYPESYLPRVDGKTLVLSPVKEINEDLIYRIGTQLYDMTLDADDYASRGGAAESAYRPIGRLVDKIVELGFERQ